MAQSTAPVIPLQRALTSEVKTSLQEMDFLRSVSPLDRRISEGVQHALHATCHGLLRGIVVTVHERLVILTGRVPTYYLKQLAQEAALSVPGIQQIHNDLSVEPTRLT